MLADLIFVFLCAIVVGSILMFIRLWRERQLIRGEYTQIQTFDTYDLETGQKKENTIIIIIIIDQIIIHMAVIITEIYGRRMVKVKK